MGRHWRGVLAGGGLTAGLLAGLAAVGWVGPPAHAQPGLGGGPGRFQVSAFVIPNVNTPGAYILDTQSGDVFQVVGRNPPELVGTAARPQKK